MMLRESENGVRIRPALLEDLEQVREFTKSTFSWGDYLPGVWARWVASRRGNLLVAELEGQVVGTTRVSYLGNGEAWLEGVRVHADYRERGIASQLIAHAHGRARRHKSNVIRLETGARNFSAQRVFRRFGYRHVLGYAGFIGQARNVEPEGVRLAKPADAKACWELWAHSWLRRASRGIVPAVFGWRWWEYSTVRLASDIRAKRVWVSPRGFMTLRYEEDGIDITMLVGGMREGVRLLNAARGIAARENKPAAFWLAPNVKQAARIAQAADFSLDEDGLEIYAREF